MTAHFAYLAFWEAKGSVTEMARSRATQRNQHSELSTKNSKIPDGSEQWESAVSHQKQKQISAFTVTQLNYNELQQTYPSWGTRTARTAIY
jgi:hypothetical protein